MLVFEPTPGLLFVSAFFLGLGFWTGAVIPATIYDVCDPKYETQFNHAYAWSTVPLSIGAGLGGIMGGVVAGVRGCIEEAEDLLKFDFSWDLLRQIYPTFER